MQPESLKVQTMALPSRSTLFASTQGVQRSGLLMLK